MIYIGVQNYGSYLNLRPLHFFFLDSGITEKSCGPLTGALGRLSQLERVSFSGKWPNIVFFYHFDDIRKKY